LALALRCVGYLKLASQCHRFGSGGDCPAIGIGCRQLNNVSLLHFVLFDAFFKLFGGPLV
jgi:hypothetical protein